MLEQKIIPYMQHITGEPEPRFTVQKMTGDASNREYFRITMENGATPATVVLMAFQPGSAFRSEEVESSQPPEFPFSNIQRFLKAGNLPVPEIYHQALSDGFVFLEDLGDVRMFDALQGADGTERRKHYEAAIDLLVDFQRYTNDPVHSGCVAFGRKFDYELLMWEFEHYLKYGLEVLHNSDISESDRGLFESYFHQICLELAAAPQRLAHRDFQSKNLMLGEAGLRVIDFQDALMGPGAYDLVALLRDSYVVLEPEEVEGLIDYYLAAAGPLAGLDADAFKRLFYLQTVQRKLKDAGRFVFIDREKHNPSFLEYIPDSLAYVGQALAQLPDLAPLAKLLARFDERIAT